MTIRKQENQCLGTFLKTERKEATIQQVFANGHSLDYLHVYTENFYGRAKFKDSRGMTEFHFKQVS